MLRAGENRQIRNQGHGGFPPLNLIAPWPMLPRLDLVFMRNVMIYFDVETKKTILKKIRGCMLPHATLFLGTAETTLNLGAA